MRILILLSIFNYILLIDENYNYYSDFFINNTGIRSNFLSLTLNSGQLFFLLSNSIYEFQNDFNYIDSIDDLNEYSDISYLTLNGHNYLYILHSNNALLSYLDYYLENEEEDNGVSRRLSNRKLSNYYENYNSSNKFKSTISKIKIEENEFIILTYTDINETNKTLIYNLLKYEEDIQSNPIEYPPLLIEYNSLPIYPLLYACDTFINNSLIFCSYYNNTIYGQLIDNNFEIKLYKQLFDDKYYTFTNMKFYKYDDKTAILLCQNKTQLYLSKNYIVNDTYFTNSTIGPFTHPSQNSLFSVSLALVKISDILNIFLAIYNNNEFKILWIKENSSIDALYINITNTQVLNISYIDLKIYDDKYYLFYLIKEDEEQENIERRLSDIYDFKLKYFLLQFPENKMDCRILTRNFYSNELKVISLNDFFINNPFKLSTFKFNNTNSAYIIESHFDEETNNLNNSSLEITSPNNGIGYTLKFYNEFLKNDSYSILYTNNKCYFILNTCYKGCYNCTQYSNLESEQYCIECLKSSNYYPYYSNTSQCLLNNQTYSKMFFHSELEYFFDCYSTCLSCSKRGNVNEHNCDECLDENYNMSYTKNGYCNLCEDNKTSLWIYDINSKIGKCLYNVNYCSDYNTTFSNRIYDTNECVENCPDNYPILFNEVCYDKCYTENTVINGTTCKCKDNMLWYKNKDLKNYVTCLDSDTCLEGYNFFIPDTLECVVKCPEKDYNYVFNHECLKECPYGTYESLISDNIYECLCINPFYIDDSNGLIKCSMDKNCPINKKYYIVSTNECVSNCSEHGYVYFENTCLKSCPENYFLYYDKCSILDNLNDFVNEYILDIHNNYNYIVRDNFIALTYKNNINNASFFHQETLIGLDLTNCLKKIVNTYELDNDYTFIIYNYNIILNTHIVYQIEYKIFFNNGTLIDLNICKGISISMSFPIDLEKSNINKEKMYDLSKYGYDIFNSSDKFYINICSHYTDGNKTDVPLEYRKMEYYQNVSFCEENCIYNKFNTTSLTVDCLCLTKTEFNTSNSSNYVNNSISNEFKKIIKHTNIKVIYCYNEVFKLKNFFINYGNLLVLFFFVLEIILYILFIKTGIKPLLKQINSYLKNKTFNEDKDNNETNLNKSIKISNSKKEKTNKNNNSNNINNNDDNLSYNYLKPSNPNKKKTKNKKVKFQNLDNNNMSDSNFSSQIDHQDSKKNELKDNNSNFILINKEIEKLITYKDNNLKINKKKHRILFKKTDRNLNKSIISQKNQIKISNFNTLNPSKMPIKIKPIITEIKLKLKRKLSLQSEKVDFDKTFYDEELNKMDYNNSIKYDKRNFIQYYLSFLKYQQLILFTFYVKTDLNIKILKICLFLFSFILYLTFNALFFNDDTMNYYYKKKGKYQFLYSLPKNICSSLCCALINFLLQMLALNKNLIEKEKKKITNIQKEINYLKRCIKIKIILFFLLLFILLLIFWYYISAFCIVFRNTQKNLMKNCIVSFLISMVSPFIICLIAAFFRKIAINKKEKISFFISKMLISF